MEIHEEEFVSELSSLLNRYNVDTQTDTPDYILAEHLMRCLHSYQETLGEVRRWHGWPTLAEKLRARLDVPGTPATVEE